jgi:hypothetical protein
LAQHKDFLFYPQKHQKQKLKCKNSLETNADSVDLYCISIHETILNSVYCIYCIVYSMYTVCCI